MIPVGGSFLLLFEVLVLLDVAVHQLGDLVRVDLSVLAVADLQQ